MEKQYLTVAEVSKLLRVHRNTVYKMIYYRQVDAFKAGRAWRIVIPPRESWHTWGNGEIVKRLMEAFEDA